jgi:hypothetical protein
MLWQAIPQLCGSDRKTSVAVVGFGPLKHLGQLKWFTSCW